MVEIPLSKGFVTVVDDADWPMLAPFSWCATLSRPGRAYATGVVNGKPTRMARLLVGLEHGDPRFVDHINGDTMDNRRKNLRIATPRQNSWNSGGMSTKKDSRYKGVYRARDKWRALIIHNGIRYELGSFFCERSAALAYLRAARRLRGEYHYPRLEAKR